jgi:DNA-binding transcriptional regulator/RsmH inhibitor MraZ
VAIPQELREWAGIEPNSEVAIVGCSNRVEIWEKLAFYDHLREVKNATDLIDYARDLGI